jgi:tetratricopeptide (TPR) repeat protein
VIRLLTAIAALVLLAATPAHAEWFRAETRHFIVYENARDADVRKLASDLERFDGFVRLFHAAPEVDGAQSNKLTVWVVSNIAAIQRLCAKCGSVAGFYTGRASGSVAFVPRTGDGDGANVLNAQTVLFHEYGHHFLLGSYLLAYPAWFSEGYAEFVSTIKLADKVTIGAAAQHRAYGLLIGPGLPASVLFDPQSRKTMTNAQVDALYGRGWLLTHWILFDKDRRARFQRYLTELNSGTPSLKAATDAFGDLKTLDRELDRYLHQSKLPAMILDRNRVPEPVVAVTPVSAGAAELIPLRLISTRGVDGETAASLFKKAAPIAARYPDDAVAQGWFAEIAADAGETAAAQAAVDRTLAVEPKSAQGLTYAAVLAMRAAVTSKAAADWAAARKAIIRANLADPDRAYPLELFYSTFEAEGIPPRKSAIDGLYRAQELVPQDEGLRWLAARQLLRENNLSAARRMLAPLAFNPHAPADNPASKAVARLDANDAPGALAILSGEQAKEPAKTDR